MKEPSWPIRGSMTGKGSVGEGENETLRKGVVLMIWWMVWRL